MRKILLQVLLGETKWTLVALFASAAGMDASGKVAATPFLSAVVINASNQPKSDLKRRITRWELQGIGDMPTARCKMLM